MEEPLPNNGTPNEETAIIQQKETHLEDLSVRSAEVQEIIGRPPHWLVRRGILGLLGILIIIFNSCCDKISRSYQSTYSVNSYQCSQDIAKQSQWKAGQSAC